MKIRLGVAVLAAGVLVAISSARASAQAPVAAPPAPAAQAPRAAARVGESTSDIVITASRLTKALLLDGRLDDEVYRQVAPRTGFFQQEPKEGDQATEQTEIWVLFDDKNLYLSARCLDSQPEREILTELRRDSSGIFQNESITFVIDTFLDRRNGFKFQTNALGAVQESAVVDEINNESWNTVWDVRTSRGDSGWSVEMAVPFKSLRYPGAGPQTWGINVRRVIKYKNEFTYLTPLPASFGVNAIYHMGSTATLVGLETPAQSINLELKPYAVSTVTTDNKAATPYTNDGKASTGFDFKYGLTRGLTLDATVNTDFAQVEEDLQQVNLTRFSQFFPEKRDFFLEGQAIFAFGGVSLGQNANPGEVPVPFFSRTIGLSRGQSVPVDAGVRVTGRAGKFQIGAANIQTGDKEEASAVSTNFTAIRIKRDFLRRSNIGIIATNRSPTTAGNDTNQVVGIDTNLFLFRNVTSFLYYARSNSPGATGGQDSYRGRFDYIGDRYGVVAEHLLIGEEFKAEAGYVRRTDFRRSFGQVRFSPRPKNSRFIRKYNYTGSVDYITNADRSTHEETEVRGNLGIDFSSGDTASVTYTRNFELLENKFDINPGTTVAAGGYNYQNLALSYSRGQQRKVSGRLSFAYGSLYEGTKTEAGYGGRVAIIPQFAVEPSVSLNWVRLPVGDFEAPVIGTRVIFTPNPRTQVTSFIQYNGGSRSLSSSFRMRWEYRPGSEVFIVYSDGRDTSKPGYPDLSNRSIALKVTRLLRL